MKYIFRFSISSSNMKSFLHEEWVDCGQILFQYDASQVFKFKKFQSKRKYYLIYGSSFVLLDLKRKTQRRHSYLTQIQKLQVHFPNGLHILSNIISISLIVYFSVYHDHIFAMCKTPLICTIIVVIRRKKSVGIFFKVTLFMIPGKINIR